jgi:hypothetical protein
MSYTSSETAALRIFLIFSHTVNNRKIISGQEKGSVLDIG